MEYIIQKDYMNYYVEIKEQLINNEIYKRGKDYSKNRSDLETYYIDLLLFNYIYNCFIVVELQVTELRKEYIGQIEVYMNYVDRNIKNMYQDKTIGIIIVKKENKFVLEYCSDDRIFTTTYDFF